jgi:hypothetical protein
VNPDPMTPLVKRTDDPFERGLLRAGQRERAPADAERRLLVALGVGSGSAVSAFFGAKLVARLGTKGSLATVAVVAALIGAITWLVTSRTEVPPAPPTNIAAPATPPAAPIANEPEPNVPTSRVEDLPTSAAPAPATTTRSEPPSLAREVALLEEARAALTQGDPTRTLARLDIHDREFPAGPLMPESKVLRIEALVRAGGAPNAARARKLAEAFLAAEPSGPQARRVRAVIETLE